MIRDSAGDGGRAVIAVLGCIFALGCSSDGPAEIADAGHDVMLDTGALQDSGSAEAAFTYTCSGGPPTYAATYSAVYCEILSQSCALVFCHSSDTDYLVINDEMQGYGALVNAPATGPLCAPTGLKRVDPGQPDSSLMYLKITNPPCGHKMPILYGDVSGSLDASAIEQVRQWIAAGAPNN